MVERLGTSEAGAVVGPLVRAFWAQPETRHLLPDENRRRRVLPRVMRADARDAAAAGTLLGAVVDGDIVGAAAWLPPSAHPMTVRRQLRQLVTVAPSLPWAWGALREARRGQPAVAVHRPAEEHMHLRTIGVDPAFAGRGLGSALVRPLLDVADERGLGCFLLTGTLDNVGWYERFGFTVSATFRPTPTSPPVWAMWRDPVPPPTQH